jgi:hypothetical protein
VIDGEILTIATDIMDRYLDQEWEIELIDYEIVGRAKGKGMVVLAGHTSYKDKLIRLYRPVVRNYNVHDLVMIVTHEISHALTPEDAKHGADFRKKWVEIWEEVV